MVDIPGVWIRRLMQAGLVPAYYSPSSAKVVKGWWMTAADRMGGNVLCQGGEQHPEPGSGGDGNRCRKAK